MYGSLMRNPQKTYILIHIYINFYCQQFSNAPRSHILNQEFYTFPLHVYRKYFLRIVALPESTSTLYIRHFCYSKPPNINSSTDEICVQQTTDSTLSSHSYVAMYLLPVCEIKTTATILYTYGKHIHLSRRGQIHHTFILS